jgi:hypothetical protein
MESDAARHELLHGKAAQLRQRLERKKQELAEKEVKVCRVIVHSISNRISTLVRDSIGDHSTLDTLTDLIGMYFPTKDHPKGKKCNIGSGYNTGN